MEECLLEMSTEVYAIEREGEKEIWIEQLEECLLEMSTEVYAIEREGEKDE